MAQIFPTDFEEKLTIAQNDYILFSDSEDWNKIKKAQYSHLKWEKWDTWATWPQWETWPQWPQWIQGIQWIQGEQWETWPQWEEWPQGEQWPQWETGATWNWIASITSSKSGKITTVTITETNGDSDTFQISDWQDWQWSWDVIWPSSATNWHLAVFDGTTGKLIKDGWSVPTVPTKVSELTNDSWFLTSTDVLTKNNTTSFTPSWDYNPATKKYVDDAVADLMWLGKFLSLWDASTWLPISFPLDIPYTYHTGDYFMVEIVSTATPPVNYRPNGSSYTGTASSTTESDEVAVWDFYVYDGTVWLLATNHWKTVSFANLAGSPSDNTALSNALAAKQDDLTLPATPTQWNLVTWGANNKTFVDGWAIPTWVPSGWNNWDVLTNVSWTPTWQAPSGWITNDTTWTTTTITKMWAGTSTEYNNLGTISQSTIYYVF